MFDRIVSVGGWLHGVDERDIGTELPLRSIDFYNEVSPTRGSTPWVDPLTPGNSPPSWTTHKTSPPLIYSSITQSVILTLSSFS